MRYLRLVILLSIFGFGLNATAFAQICCLAGCVQDGNRCVTTGPTREPAGPSHALQVRRAQVEGTAAARRQSYSLGQTAFFLIGLQQRARPVPTNV
jgi:hypothetical protein